MDKLLEIISQSIWRLGYGLVNRGFVAGTRDVSLVHNVQIGSGVHAVCYPTDTEGFVSRGKASAPPYTSTMWRLIKHKDKVITILSLQLHC
jgi:hypothetical protein